jgi:hypothetical protein
LQFIYDCLEIPELLSSDPRMVMLAEQRANSLREFPLGESSSSTTVGGGFGSKQRSNRRSKKK